MTCRDYTERTTARIAIESASGADVSGVLLSSLYTVLLISNGTGWPWLVARL